MTKRLQPERAERLAFMDWVALTPPVKKYLIAIENGGSRNLLEAVNIKRCGLVAGTPDYLLMRPAGVYHGMWIEFKAGKNKLTKLQEQFFETARSVDYKCVVVWKAEQAITEMKYYLGEKLYEKPGLLEGIFWEEAEKLLLQSLNN